MMIDRITWSAPWLAVMLLALLVGSPVWAIDLTGGPSTTLPGGGSCTTSGSLASGSLTFNCTIANPAGFVDVYWGLANTSAPANGNAMDASSPTQYEVFRFASSTPTSITYTSSTTVHNLEGSATQAVNTRLVLALTAGTGTVIDVAGTPADSASYGDIQRLFRISSNTFSVHVTVSSNTSPIPTFGASNPNVYDRSQTSASTRGALTNVSVGYYYNECS
jgi:hypothetical protein